MANPDSFLHLARPLGPAAVGAAPSTAPLNVIIQPQAIFSILDHSSRRPPGQHRVIGTLLGTRSDDNGPDSTITIHSSFAVGHTETAEQVEVDMEYQKNMLALHLKANPREILVGWYATSAELNTFSALIQNFYGGQGDGTWPHPAVHMTVNTQIEGKGGIEVRTYISAPVGVTAERAADSAAFIPVPFEIRYNEADRAGLEMIASAKDREDRTATILNDVESLERAIEDILSMLDRVAKYVENVIEEEETPSVALGQFLLNALALAPKVDPADIERDFANHIQDVLVVSYLANTIRTQMDLSNRLATAQLTLGGPEGGVPMPSKEEGGQQQRGGGRGGFGRGGGRSGQQREPREQTA
jgi:translation initiation factor 3 subunit F